MAYRLQIKNKNKTYLSFCSEFVLHELVFIKVKDNNSNFNFLSFIYYKLLPYLLTSNVALERRLRVDSEN